MKYEKKKISWFKQLNHKLLVSINLLTVIMCISSCLIGYFQYNQTIRRMYNDNGYMIGEMIIDEIDNSKIAAYATEWKEDSYYSEMETYLKKVQKASGVAYIYIMAPRGEKMMRYIYDSSGMKIGDYEVMSSYAKEIRSIYLTGERAHNEYFIRHSEKYGYLTSSTLPIKDDDGKTVALLFVDVHMELIISTLLGYILRVMLISAIILLIFGFSYWKFLSWAVIRPIDLITKNAYEFENSGAKLSDTLDQIKTGDELQELAATISSMEHSIVQYIENIEKVTAEKERIGAELNIATKIQAHMLPSDFPPFPERSELDIFASMTPAKEVGGDFYDFFFIDEDHLALVMADVSGKGVPAALFMVIAKTLIKIRSLMGGTPADILKDVNNQLCEGNVMDMFVTVWLGILEISTGHGIEANAGHENPVIKRAEGEYEMIKTKHSPALAVMEGMTFRNHEFEMYPGDKLFVYTDGVPEANNEKKEFYGTDRMLAVLNQNLQADITETLVAVKKDIDTFKGDAPQFDDITMLCMEYRENR